MTNLKTKGECDFPGCTKEKQARGLCAGHFGQQRRGTPLRPLRVPKAEQPDCIIEDCENKQKQRGYCSKHAHQFLDPDCTVEDCTKKQAPHKEGYCTRHFREIVEGIMKEFKTCSVEGCNKGHYAKSFCHNHYMTLAKPVNERKCDVKGCTREHVARGYCGRHYSQIRDNGRITVA